MEEQAQTQPVSVQPSPAPPSPVKQRNKPLIIIAVLVFLLMAGGLVYLGYQNYQLQQRLNLLLAQRTDQTQPADTLTPTQPPAEADQKDNWETYTDTSFSFKYPPNMASEASSEPNVSYLVTPDFEPSGLTGYQIQVTIVANDIPTIDQYMQIVPNTPEQTALDKQNLLTINGNQVVVRTYKNSWVVYKKYYVYSPKLAIILQGTGKDHSTFDQILSTFKFAE